MKIQLVLSGTYLFRGKVFQKKGADGKQATYNVDKSTGDHLLAQRNERDVPYFRLVQEDTPAVLPADKRVEKGGIPQSEDSAPAPVDDPVEASVDDDEAISADDVEVEDDDEEPVAL
jgi:hypothetical protein